MLSAVAARKAALVASAAAVETEPPTLPNTPSPAASSSKPPSKKRRPSAPSTSATLYAEQKPKMKKARSSIVKNDIQLLGQPNVLDCSSASFALREGLNYEGNEDLPTPNQIEEDDVELGVTSLTRSINGGQRVQGEPLADSSDDDEEVHSPRPSAPTQLPNSSDEPPPLSTYTASPGRNHFSLADAEVLALLPQHSSQTARPAPACALILRPQETLTLLGQYTLASLYGSISLSGDPLPSARTAYPVFAPRSAPLPVIRCETAAAASPLQNAMDHAISGRVRDNLAPGDAVILVQELHTGVEGLGNICRTFQDVFRPPRWGARTVDLGLSGVYVVPRQTSEMQPLVLPPSWEVPLSTAIPLPSKGDTIQSFSDGAPVHLVQGPKKTGKSTFARTLLNRLLVRYARVAFLECDPGQSESSPPGTVALTVHNLPLYGPPFTHPTLPYSAHFIGASTPRNTPSRYLAAINALFDTYTLDVARCAELNIVQDSNDERISDIVPLVVNTMGWTKGLGADLNGQIAVLVRPTAIFALEAPKIVDAGWPSRPTEGGAPLDTVDSPVYALESAANEQLAAHYTPADLRALSILSHLHAVFPASATGIEAMNVAAGHWDCTPLRARPPFEVEWSRAVDAVFLDAPGTEDVVPTEIGRVLNGALVALVEVEPGAVDGAVSEENVPRDQRWRYAQGSEPPPPSLSRCLGLALIRGVADEEPSSAVRAQVITPLPSSVLQNARVVVKGEMELPIWGMLDEGKAASGPNKGRENTPYLRWPGGGNEVVVGGERRRVRRNLMRKGQM